MEELIEQLKTVLTGSKNTLLICHDFPDPDCLASAWGMQFLLKTWKIPSVIAYGGFIGRPENQAMVQELEIEALPLAGLDFGDFDRIFFVDTQPGTGNHSLPKDLKVHGALDHHPKVAGTEELPFSDVRIDLGATATIVTQYLRKAKVEINFKLATGLYYGVKSDTQDLARETTAMDREVYHYLFSRIDHRLLSQIETPVLEMSFFQSMTRAFRGLEVQGQLGWCYLGKIPRPDQVAQIADLFVRVREVEWMFCAGYLKNTLYFSIRTRALDTEAGTIARQIVQGEKGSAGGHGQMAAGKVEFNKTDLEILERLKKHYYDLLQPAISAAPDFTPIPAGQSEPLTQP